MTGSCDRLLLLVTGDCAEHYYHDWLLDCTDHSYSYWLLCRVLLLLLAAAGYWRLCTIMTGDWRLCRALLLLLVARLCSAEHSTIITGTGVCAESCCCWLLETVQADCAEHYHYDWGLETVQSTPITTDY